MAHYWLQLGQSETWLRILPIVFSILTIPVVYLFANTIFTKNKPMAGYIAAFLLAIAPFHIYYAQEFRSYSLLCLLGALSMLLFYQKKYFWLALINTLLLYTHYAGIFLIAAQIIFTLVYRRSEVLKFSLSMALSALLYLPWLPELHRQLVSGINIDQYLPGWKNVLSISPIKAMPTLLFKLVAGRINLMPRLLYGLYSVTVMLITFGAIIVSSRERKFLTVWTFVPIGVMLVVSLLLPQNQPFRVIFVLPSLILLFTGAALRFPKLFLTLFVYISIVGNLLYFTRPRLQREQWRQAGEFLQASSAPIIVKFPESFAPLKWYQPNLPVTAVAPSFPAKADDVMRRLDDLPLTTHKVLLLDYLTDLTDPDHSVEKVLIEKGFQPGEITDFSGVGFIREFDKQ